MRTIEIKRGNLRLSDEVELFYEKTITPFGTSAKIGAPKEYIGRNAYVIILKKRVKPTKS